MIGFVKRFAIYLLFSGGALGVYILANLDHSELMGRVVGDLGQITADHVWSTGQQNFVAYNVQRDEISIAIITATESRAITAVRKVSVAGADPSSIAVSRDGSRAFWRTGKTLHAYDVATGSSIERELDIDPASLVAVSAADVVTLIDPSGAVTLLKAASLDTITTGSISVKGANLTEVSGPFVAVVDKTSGAAAVIDTGHSSEISLREAQNFGGALSAVTLSDSGSLSVATESGAIISGDRLGAPGYARALQIFDDQSFFVAGEFSGLHWIRRNGPSQNVAPIQAGARTMAVTKQFCVIGFPSSTQVLSVNVVTKAQPKTKSMFRTWVVISLFLALFSSGKAVVKVFGILRGLLRRDKADQKLVASLKHIREMLNPDPHLIAASNAQQCVLFAGEDLSKSCAMPTWKHFVLGFIDVVDDKMLLPPEQAQIARNAFHRGEFTRVVDGLEPIALANPDLLNDFAKRLYLKAAPLSPIHEAVGRIGICSAVTPALDLLVEKAFKEKSPVSFAPCDAAEALSGLAAGRFIAMKLRGVFSRPETLSVWLPAAQKANHGQPQLGRLLGEILTTKTVVFVGATLEEIEAWLAPADLKTAPVRSHWALLPGSERSNVKKAGQLSTRYNIQSLTYSSEDSSQLVNFLGKLEVKAETTLEPRT